MALKEWHKAKASPEESKLKEYIEAKRAAKKAVAKAQQKEREQFEERLDTKEGQRAVFRIAKQMAGERKDIVDTKCLKSENGEVLTEPHAVNGRWRHYMEKLLNVENNWDRILEADIVEGSCKLISEREIEEAIRSIKVGKAAGPSEIVAEMLKAAESSVRITTKICNHVVREGAMPRERGLSTLIPNYKGKGDPMECGSYRAIKLLEHGMKVVERVLERRLRMKVNIDDMQFGFMSRKGTVDAIFIVRQLQKFMEKRKDLFYAFEILSAKRCCKMGIETTGCRGMVGTNSHGYV